MLPPLLLLAERRHVVLAPAVLVSVCSATCVILAGYEDLPCAGAGIADFDVVHFPAAEPLARCDNSAVVPVEPSVVLPPLLLPAEYTHVVPVPAVLGPMWCAVAWHPVWIARLPRVAVVGLMFGVAAQAAPVARAP